MVNERCGEETAVEFSVARKTRGVENWSGLDTRGQSQRRG